MQKGLVPPKLLVPIVRSRTVADEVAERLVLAIASGEQAAGARLTEGGLAEVMKVSRVPAREALQSLASKGILVPAGQRGLKVIEFSADEGRQVLEVRMALEMVGLTRAMDASAVQPELLGRARDVLADMAALSQRSDALELAQCDLRFHRELLSLSGNGMLLKVWDGLNAHLLILFCRDWHRNSNRVGEVELHRHLFEIVASGDKSRLAVTFENHFEFD